MKTHNNCSNMTKAGYQHVTPTTRQVFGKGAFMELQLLKNVPAYKRQYWTFPALAVERQINASHRWIAFLLLFGKTAIGIRIYYAFAQKHRTTA